MLFLRFLRECISAIGERHLDRIFPSKCLLSSFLQFLSKEWCLNNVSFKWLLSKFYIIFSMPSAFVFSFIGYLISTNIATLLWTYEGEKFNTSNVILSMSSRTLKLLIETPNVNKNYQVKWYGQGRRRRILWISFHLVVLLKLFIYMTFAKSLWKCELAELFRIPCSCGRLLVVIIGCEDFLSLNLHVIRMSLSIVFFSYM